MYYAINLYKIRNYKNQCITQIPNVLHNKYKWHKEIHLNVIRPLSCVTVNQLIIDGLHPIDQKLRH